MSKTENQKEVYLFTGEVDSRRQSAVEELVAGAIGGGSTDFDLEKFDGFSATAEDIITAAATLPFLSERKVVIVDRVDRLSPEDQCKIALFIPKMGPASRLILLIGEDQSAKWPSKQKKDEDEEDEEDKPKKRRKGLQPDLVKAAKDAGTVVDFQKLRSDALSAQIRKGVLARGKKIEGRALQALTWSIAASPSIAETELDKLAAYVGDQTAITLQDVDRVVTMSPDDRAFPLIDAIAMRRPERAISLLNETFAASAKPDSQVTRILGIMGKHFRLLYQTKFLKMQGISNLKAVPEELQSVLMQDKKQNPMGAADFQQKRLIEQVDTFSVDEIRLCLKHVLACEMAVKGLGKTAASPRLSLEMLVLRLSQRKRSKST